MYKYRAFQLTILSELAFPELLESADESVDVRIAFGDVSPQGIESPRGSGLSFQVNPQLLWLNIPNVARFLVSNGQTITIFPVEGADEASIRLFLLGSCLGALLMQRGLLLLHGNAIQVGKFSISFAGHSGAGKSTLSGAFFKRGYSILADDVCAINEKGEVLPSFPQIKLWADAAKHLAIDTTALRRIRPNIEKFAIPLNHQFYQNPMPLKIIYILHSHNKNTFELKNFSGMSKLQPLKNQLYRRQYLKGMDRARANFIQCGSLVSRIELARITRPNEGYSLQQLVDFVTEDLSNRGFEHAYQ